MIKFILLLAVFFLIMLLLLGFSVVRAFYSFIFGNGNSKKSQSKQSRSNRNTQHSSNQQSNYSTPKPKKIFPSDEGEYVEYEEVESSVNSSKK